MTPEKPEDVLLCVTPAASKSGMFVAVASFNEATLHRDNIDLNSNQRRKQFVDGILKALPGINGKTDDFRRDLTDRLLKFAAAPPGQDEANATCAGDAEDPRGAELAKMPESITAEAERVLADPGLFEKVVTDIEAVGVAGERALASTLYLLGTSAQLPKPLATIVRGPSASGKSYIVEQVASLFPPEIVLNATSITCNALYYFPPGTLRHRWVVAGERSRLEDDDRAEATRALREMLETGRLSKAVPIKEHERITTRMLEQEGPIAFVETTTLANLFEEDANRCLLLWTNESREQTARILIATAARAAGGTRPDQARRIAVHHALQRMLPRTGVTIPFAPQLAALYPTDRLDARRSFRHLLGLVGASALLHFRQRERGPSSEVIAW
jgi:hypothetical protein